MKGRLVKVIVSVIVITAIGFGGFYGYNTFFVKKATAASTQYYTASARKMNLQVSIQGTGAAYAAATKEVLPNNNGTLKDLNVKVGDTVTAEQKLFVSDSDDVRKNVTTAKNNLTKQKLTLSSDQSAQKVDDNKIAMDKIAVSDAQNQVNDANKQLNNMTVTAPIGGVVTAVNYSNGDSAQSGKAVLTVVDMNSIKIKVAVDELDIDKVKTGQKAEIKFDAVKDKTYEGSVETISPVGTTSNNVTNYDVIVNVKDSAGIKLGMNGNVTILVDSKENVLVIPAEALVESNGQKFVRVENTDGTASVNNGQTASANSQTQRQNGNAQGSKQAAGGTNNRIQTTSSSGKLIAIKTGMETQNYIEVTEGLTEGQKVLVQLPQTSGTTNTNNNRNNFGGMGGGFGGNTGGYPGGNMGGQRSQSGNNSGARN